jgi:RNA polymerase sigma factor (sigma-70 family)
MALITRARAGDAAALNALLARYVPRLKRWAHRRLPGWARDLRDTDDLVQDAFAGAVRNLHQLSSDHPLGFQEYLRVAISNAVRDEIRRVARRPGLESLSEDIMSRDPSPLERLGTRQRLARYERALACLSADEREAVIARLEFGFTHQELAASLGKPSADAARKAARAAMDKLLALMQDDVSQWQTGT